MTDLAKIAPLPKTIGQIMFKQKFPGFPWDNLSESSKDSWEAEASRTVVPALVAAIETARVWVAAVIEALPPDERTAAAGNDLKQIDAALALAKEPTPTTGDAS